MACQEVWRGRRRGAERTIDSEDAGAEICKQKAGEGRCAYLVLCGVGSRDWDYQAPVLQARQLVAL